MVGCPVVQAAMGTDTSVHLLDRYQAPAELGMVDTLAAQMDMTGTVAGSTLVAADWPRSQNGLPLS